MSDAGAKDGVAQNSIRSQPVFCADENSLTKDVELSAHGSLSKIRLVAKAPRGTRESKEEYAMKIYLGDDALEDSCAEQAVLSKISHPRIVKYVGIIPSLKAPHLITRYVPFALQRVVSHFGNDRNRAALHVLEQLLDAVAYLHHKQILHMDIKPDNIRVGESGDITLIDFGNSITPYLQYDRVHTELTTSLYRAPERFVYKAPFSRAMDVWSIGCVVYEVLEGSQLISVSHDTRTSMMRSMGISQNDELSESTELAVAEAAVLKTIVGRVGWTPRPQHFEPTPELAYVRDSNPAIPTRGLFSDVLRGAGDTIEDLLTRMLDPNPTSRVCITDARSHACFRNARRRRASA